MLLFVISLQITAQDYFPLKIGNSWTYCSSQDTTYKRVYLIKDTVNIGGSKCFLYGRQNDETNDTLWKDKCGSVWKLKNGIPVLWLDFTKDSGSVYYYPQFDSELFTVTVRKYLSIDTYVITFNNCIELFFDIPSLIDDEEILTFAPEIGLIKKLGAWSDDLLYSAYINGVIVSLADNLENILSKFSLSQNYPNPFNPSTLINYSIPQNFSGEVIELNIYSITGDLIATIVKEELVAGNYKSLWKGTNSEGKPVSSGIYIYQLKAGAHFVSGKMNLVR